MDDVASQRLERIARYVQQRLQEVAAQQGRPAAEVSYRWQHTLRVSQYGRMLAEATGASVELCVAACLLHDVAVFDPGKWEDHGRLGAQIVRPFLPELGYAQAEVEVICDAVADHADVQHPERLEAKVVTDADNVDRFGAYRIILWCVDELQDYDRLIAKLAQRLERLRDYRRRQVMQTPAGQSLFEEQLDLQIAFFEAMVQEKELTVLPAL